MSRPAKFGEHRTLLLVMVSSAPLILGLALGWRLRDQPIAGACVAVIGLLFSFGSARSTWLGTMWASRGWRRFAADRGYAFHSGFDGEPQFSGERDGVKFRISIASPRMSGRGHYTRTYGTAAIQGEVPEGLRLYLRSPSMWANDYSGLRTVVTGDEGLDGEFFVEGDDEADVIDYVTESTRRSAIEQASSRWPNVMIYGRDEDGLPIAADEQASGAITLVEGGRRPARRLDEFVAELCDFAEHLSRPA